MRAWIETDNMGYPNFQMLVARRVRAWIETAILVNGDAEIIVARRVRAWIETKQGEDFNETLTDVARRVRAWIETSKCSPSKLKRKSRTPCACVD